MKMHQIIAIDAGVKNRATSDLTAIYHKFQQKPMFAGQTKVFAPKDEDGPVFPPEQQLVQNQIETLLQEVAEVATEMFDTVATKDRGNCDARADVVLDDETLLKDIPATHLLFLEKQLTHINTVLAELPTLDPAYRWAKDVAGGYRADPVETTKMAKTHEVVRLAEATEHHPEQAQLVAVDKAIGKWTTTKQSGAMSAERKKQLLGRGRNLLKAVKFARETANATEVKKQDVGAKLFGYLLG